MAGKIIAQLLVSGGMIVFRAAAQAYQQALANGQRSGGAEALKRATKAKQMTIDEARKILGVEKDSAWEVIEKRYNHLFSVNLKTSHYLLSKVFRAKEALDIEHPDDVKKWREENPDLAKQAEELVAKTSRSETSSRAKDAPAGASEKGEGDASRRRNP